MIFDYFASIADTKACPQKKEQENLCAGFGDECLVWSCKKNNDSNKYCKDEARESYRKWAIKTALTIPEELKNNPDFSSLPHKSWSGIEVEFTLKTPWYAKDDRRFHVLDNPVRKDRVFGVPYLSSSSWKGLLRYACRMEDGLLNHLEKNDMKIDGWKDKNWIIHLFGNEKNEQEDFRAGALVFYPTWFEKIGFEVINPHDRKTKAGTNPIIYEVVPPETIGCLKLLYAPLPGQTVKHEALINLTNAIDNLLTKYGISAKRTVGWGTANTDKKDWRIRGSVDFIKKWENHIGPDGEKNE